MILCLIKQEATGGMAERRAWCGTIQSVSEGDIAYIILYLYGDFIDLVMIPYYM
jgi:hypothetical protein